MPGSFAFYTIKIYTGCMLRKIIAIIIFTVSITHAFSSPSVHTLDNGATVVIVSDATATVASSYVFVRTGSIFEGKWLGAGLSHFLEHLLAGGTTRLKTEATYRDIIDELGGAYNAYTTYDHTAYYIHSSSENVQIALQTLYEWMAHATWTETEFNREKGVIIKEMDRARNNIPRQIYQSTQFLFYKDSPYRYPVIGFQAPFEALTSPEVHAYYTTQYVPENMVIVVGGDVVESQVLQAITDTFGSLPAIASPTRYIGSEPTILSQSHQLVSLPDLASKRLVFRYPTVSFYHPDVFPLDLLAYIFGHGEQSLLYQEWVVRKRIATSVSVESITPSSDFGYFEISVVSDRAYQELADALDQFLRQVQRNGFSHNVLQRAKQQKKTDYILSNVSLDHYIKHIGRSMMLGSNPLYFEQYSTGFNQIGPVDLQAVMAQYLVNERRHSLEFVHKKPTVNAQSPSMPPPPTRISVKPGIDIHLASISNNQLARVVCRFDHGLFSESIETNGIGHLSTALLGKGTTHMSRNQFQAMFEERGASLSSKFTHNHVYYELTATEADMAMLLPYFLKGLTQFDVENEVFNESKTQVLKKIQRVSEDWFKQSYNQFKSTIISTASVMSRPLIGTNDSVQTLTNTDVNAYVRTMVETAPIQMMIQSTNPKKYVPIVKNEFRQLAPRVPSVAHGSLDYQQNHLVRTTVSSNVGVVLSGILLPESLQSSVHGWLKVQVFDALLSGMSYPSGLLHNQLRSEQLVYVVHAVPIQYKFDDWLYIYALTEPKKVTNVSQVIRESYRQLTQSITKKQLTLAKEQVLFNQLQRNQHIAAQTMALFEQYDRFGRYISISEISDTLDTITHADMMAFSRDVLVHPPRLIEINQN